jgi:hypothetical protein
MDSANRYQKASESVVVRVVGLFLGCGSVACNAVGDVLMAGCKFAAWISSTGDTAKLFGATLCAAILHTKSAPCFTCREMRGRGYGEKGQSRNRV